MCNIVFIISGFEGGNTGDKFGLYMFTIFFFRIYRRHSSQKKEVTEAAVMETIAEVTPVPEEAPAIEEPAQGT